MTSEPVNAFDHQRQMKVIEGAARDAVRAALRRHMLLGESVAVVGQDGGVQIQ